MSNTAKIVFISLGASLVISTLIYSIERGDQSGFYLGEIFLGSAVISLVEVFLLLLIGVVLWISKPKGTPARREVREEVLDSPATESVQKLEARSFFLAAGLVLLIGISLCFGAFSSSF